jgi:hypothetical protein
MHDSIRDYRVPQKPLSRRVADLSFDLLIDRWESHVDQIAQNRLGDRDEYLNAMDTRQVLAEAIAVANEMQSVAVLPRLAEADRRFRSLVLFTEVCAWGAYNAYRHGWTREREWWYWTRPRRVTFWPEHPEIAVLDRVIDVGQAVTCAQTQLTLTSLRLYNGALLVDVAMVCRDERLPPLLLEQPRTMSAMENLHIPLVVTDDQGTRYESTHRGSYHPGWRTGEPIRWDVTHTITPALSSTVRLLNFSIAEVEIVGQDAMATPKLQVLMTLPGPWEFAVPLQ